MNGKNTTLCYIEKDECYLMLHRIKKKIDENKDKWIGIGGKFEAGESPEECLIREVREETGLFLTAYRYRGIVTFVSDEWGTEYMHLFTAHGFEGDIPTIKYSKDHVAGEEDEKYLCEEGRLEWVPINEITKLNIWEGDKIFLRLLAEDSPFFSLKLSYQGDCLVGSQLNVY